ncbi:MAG: hypothetical protein JRJ23_07770 [Deltaproteobacteria bacterium]|nr:hypothetical protein [Deltaproteobacteria bacterium]MBW1914672.1 hypothetical protein [Deltaproteobacteria bacterium]
MVLSKRERYIAVITLAVLLVLILDSYIISPFVGQRERTAIEKQQLQAEMDRATTLFKRRILLEQKWQEMLNDGLQNDVSKAESQTLHAMDAWARQGELAISSVKPGRGQGTGQLKEVLFQITGDGSMKSICSFLWQIENTSFPIRIKEVQMGSNDENGKSMSLQLEISVLYIS